VAGGTAPRRVQVLPLVVKKLGRPGAGGEVKKTVTVSAKQNTSFRVFVYTKTQNKYARL
jgi:hypothetical protein